MLGDPEFWRMLADERFLFGVVIGGAFSCTAFFVWAWIGSRDRRRRAPARRAARPRTHDAPR